MKNFLLDLITGQRTMLLVHRKLILYMFHVYRLYTLSNLYCTDVGLCGTIYHQIYVMNHMIHLSINSIIYSYPNNYCNKRFWIYQEHLVKLYCIPSLHWVIKVIYAFSQKCISVSCDSTDDLPYHFVSNQNSCWFQNKKSRLSGLWCLVRDRNSRMYL